MLEPPIAPSLQALIDDARLRDRAALDQLLARYLSDVRTVELD